MHIQSLPVDVDLRQLRALIAVAETRSFTAAAGRLHLSQQSVSALIRRLESTLGVDLFERSTRRVDLTTAGHALLDEVRAALEILDNALDAASAGPLTSGVLRLAFTPGTSFGQLQVLLAALADEPLIPTVDVREVWSDELSRALREARFDVGIGVEVPAQGGIVTRPWLRHRVDLLVAANHPFATLPVVRVAQLDGIALALPDRLANPAFHDVLVSLFRRVGVAPVILGSPRVSGPVPPPVSNGHAATVWLTGMDDKYIPNGFLRVPLGEPETLVTTYLVTCSNRRSVSAARMLEKVNSAVLRTSGNQPAHESGL
jgi:DNA-binding transcriptional LysR family regulator